jgi:hypothetical protein
MFMYLEPYPNLIGWPSDKGQPAELLFGGEHLETDNVYPRAPPKA